MSEEIIREIKEEREKQDAQWGGPAHDDSHDEADWIPIIAKFLQRADVAAKFIGVGPENQIQFSGGDPRKAFERRMIQIAALAVAAVKASRHRSVPHGCVDTKPGFTEVVKDFLTTGEETAKYACRNAVCHLAGQHTQGCLDQNAPRLDG